VLVSVCRGRGASTEIIIMIIIINIGIRSARVCQEGSRRYD